LKEFTLDPSSIAGSNETTANPGFRYRKRFGWSDAASAADQVLKWTEIAFNTTMIGSAGSIQTRVFFNGFETLMNEQNKLAPSSLQGYITCRKYSEMIFEEVLLKTAVAGSLISLILAFIILVLATRNIIIAVYSIFAILGIVLFLIAFMVVIGWSIGVIESIAITIIVGLSVDYTVHIANCYVQHSKHFTNRETILRETLTEIGISVLSGGITTCSSVLMLFFTTITFFTKFGEFIFVNIVASLIYSFGFFCILLAIIGPTKDQGTWTSFVNCWKRYCGSGKQKESSSELEALELTEVDNSNENKS